MMATLKLFLFYNISRMVLRWLFGVRISIRIGGYFEGATDDFIYLCNLELLV